MPFETLGSSFVTLACITRARVAVIDALDFSVVELCTVHRRFRIACRVRATNILIALRTDETTHVRLIHWLSNGVVGTPG